MLGYLCHTLMDNRHGLMVDAEVSQADGYGERDTASKILDRLPSKRRKTLGADKGYDTKDFVKACRRRRITPISLAIPTDPAARRLMAVRLNMRLRQ